MVELEGDCQIRKITHICPMKKMIIIAVGFLLVNCGEGNVSPEDRLSQLNNEAHLTLPAGSLVAEYKSNKSVIDPIWVAKVKIPPSKISEFKRSVDSIKGTEISCKKGFFSTVSWWKPAAPTITKVYYTGDNIRVLIILSEEDKEWFAYIQRAVF